MTPLGRPLRLYGAASPHPPLAWTWVEAQLSGAATYWVDARTQGHPHPRPVWGLWQDGRLHLSLGSPAIRAALRTDPTVTVHLDSGTDVVIVEGEALPASATPSMVIQAYNAKYDWDYDVADYGELTVVEAITVLAWRTAGWAGRDSFQETGRWMLRPADPDRGAREP